MTSKQKTAKAAKPAPAELQDEAVGLGSGRNPLPYQSAIGSLSKLSAPKLVPDATEPVTTVP